MAENSKIEWCDHTFNPWRGCTKVSEGCAHCYAETLSKRNPAVLGQWGPGKPRVKASPAMWKEPLKWNAQRLGLCERCGPKTDPTHEGRCPNCSRVDIWHPTRPRVFCASLADWLDDEVPVEWLVELLELIMRTSHLDWLLLTKRPQNFMPRLESVLKQFPRNCLTEDEAMLRVRIEIMLSGWSTIKHTHPKLGRENYWIGTTVENQARADERIPQLLRIPAKLRFLSCEPLLSKVDLAFDEERLTGGQDDESVRTRLGPHGIHWVICGGESGPGARPMHPNWARSLRDQCAAAGVPFFFKQWGDWVQRELATCRPPPGALNHQYHHHQWYLRVGKKKAGRELDGRTHDEFSQVERGTAA